MLPFPPCRQPLCCARLGKGLQRAAGGGVGGIRRHRPQSLSAQRARHHIVIPTDLRPAGFRNARFLLSVKLGAAFAQGVAAAVKIRILNGAELGG